jgi:hypothetical protein
LQNDRNIAASSVLSCLLRLCSVAHFDRAQLPTSTALSGIWRLRPVAGNGDSISIVTQSSRAVAKQCAQSTICKHLVELERSTAINSIEISGSRTTLMVKDEQIMLPSGYT